MTDGGGGLLAGIPRMFPSTPTNSDSYRYKQNTYKLISRDIGGDADNITFLRFCHELQRAVSRFIYEDKVFKEWAEKSMPHKERIIPFLDWWDKRRSRWRRAFKNNDVESHNLLESAYNSRYVTI